MRIVRRTLLLAAAIVAGCGSPGPTDVGLPASIASLRIVTPLQTDPTSLIVHQMVLFEAEARTRRGTAVGLGTLPIWETSDPAVATVSRDGVVSAQARGLATIRVSVGGAWAETTVVVKARLRIAGPEDYIGCYVCVPHPLLHDRETWKAAAGDTLLLTATYVDVDGVPIDEVPAATWKSSAPEAVRVGPDGRTIALTPKSVAEVTATTTDGAVSINVYVVDAVAGLPATLRLAHGAMGLGEITFVHNKGGAVKLEFGESVVLPITSGRFTIEGQGLPLRSDWSPRNRLGALVREGEELAVYVVGGTGGPTGPIGTLTWAWDRPTEVADDSVRIRLVQGFTGAIAVHVLDPGEPADEIPVLCYFDAGDIWGYDYRPAADIDFVLQGKFSPGGAQQRIRTSPHPGSSVTYVITWATPLGGGHSLVAFPDT
jgi:hypothetical protein